MHTTCYLNTIVANTLCTLTAHQPWSPSQCPSGTTCTSGKVQEHLHVSTLLLHKYCDSLPHSSSATFPDQLDKILPADGSRTVGELFVSVLKDMEKLQNFQVYCEGSRVPLELGVDTSVLVGQKVNVKFLPGPCEYFLIQYL